MDYKLPAKALQTELTRILETMPLWEGKANILQVIDTKKDCGRLRALVSSKDLPTG